MSNFAKERLARICDFAGPIKFLEASTERRDAKCCFEPTIK